MMTHVSVKLKFMVSMWINNSEGYVVDDFL